MTPMTAWMFLMRAAIDEAERGQREREQEDHDDQLESISGS